MAHWKAEDTQVALCNANFCLYQLGLGSLSFDFKDHENSGGYTIIRVTIRNSETSSEYVLFEGRADRASEYMRKIHAALNAMMYLLGRDPVSQIEKS